MILCVDINSYESEYKALTEEQWAELRDAIPTLPEQKPEWGLNGIMVDDDGLRALARFNIKATLSYETDHNTSTMLVKLQNRIEQLEMKAHEDDVASLVSSGAAVQIAIPDLGLLYVTEVAVLTDCCTNELQGYLDEGWRLLAVCPPNAQRRPDYVLGRRKEAA